MYTVYVQTNSEGFVTAINSSEFIKDYNGWIAVDAGDGDRFLHAAGNYLPLPIMTDSGACRYKLEGGRVVECLPEEMEEDLPPSVPSTDVSNETLEKLAALEQQIEMLLSGVTVDE